MRENAGRLWRWATTLDSGISIAERLVWIAVITGVPSLLLGWIADDPWRFLAVAVVASWLLLAAMVAISRMRMGRTSPAAATPTTEDLIRRFDAHIETGRPLGRRFATLRRQVPPASDAEWTEALYAARDWMNGASDLMDNHCISRRQDFRVVWRSIPSILRYQRRDDIAAAALARRRGADKWIPEASKVLRECIDLMERRTASRD